MHALRVHSSLLRLATAFLLQGTALLSSETNVVPPTGGVAQSQVDQGSETQITKNKITKQSAVQQLI